MSGEPSADAAGPGADGPLAGSGVDAAGVGGGGGGGGRDGGGGGNAPAPDADEGANVADPFVALDGTRIKGRWAETPEHLRIWLGWYDTQLGEACAFMPAADGELRCLPQGAQIGLTWRDAACTIPLWHSTSCPHGTTHLLPTTVGCTTRSAVYQRGAIWQGDVYSTGSGLCQGGFPPDDTITYYQIGPELPASGFVKAREVGRPLPGGAAPVEPVLLESEDGARASVRWQDATTKEECSLSSGTDGRMRCFPHPLSSVSRYYSTDSRCITEQTLFYTHSVCHPDPAGALVRNPGCSYTLVSLGPRLTQLFIPDGQMPCFGPVSPDIFVVHAIGPPITDNLAVLEVTVDDSTAGRLHRVWIGPAGGRRTLSNQWFDSTRRELCVPQLFADGSYRCAPPLTPYQSFTFADAQCTQPVHETLFGDDCPPPMVTFYDDTCERRQAFYTVNARITGPTFTRFRQTGTCDQVDSTGVFHPSNFYSLTRIPDADFAAVTVRDPQ
jgi:hypothetical protein